MVGLIIFGYLIILGDAMMIKEIFSIITNYLGMEKVARVEKNDLLHTQL